MKGKGQVFRVKDRRAQYVRGQNVTGKLNALILQAEQFGKRMRQGGFTYAGYIFNQ